MTVLHFGDPVRHFWMTRSVARVMGVSLSEAMAEGRLSSEDYALMVSRCRTCQQVTDCELWLASARNGPAEMAPSGCLNADGYAQARGDDGPPRKREGSEK